MAGLLPLPAGYADADEAVRDFEQKEEKLRELTDEIHELEKRKLVLEERADKETAEEIEAQASVSLEHFQAVLRRGAALGKIRAFTRELLAESDASAYAGMAAQLEGLMDRLTASRYRRVELDRAQPLGLQSQSGSRLQWDLLSAGTKDVLALALRLTMASRFLGDTPGFLMMDDPLVDMDPVRQEAAAAVLREYAEAKQVIIFTCHPRHAELLGGNLIELQGA
jgi:exonuclease SbcC